MKRKTMPFSILNKQVILKRRGDSISDFITDAPDGKYCLEIISADDITALQQRYWRCLIALMSDQSGYDKLYCSNFAKVGFLDLEILTDKDGNKFKNIPSTSDLSKKVFSGLIDWFYEFCLANDYAPMTPQEYKDSLFN